MILKEFIENFSHNNLVRLVYKVKSGSGHEIVFPSWDHVLMDWEVCKTKYANREVIGLASIGGMKKYPEAINIVIERIPLEDERDRTLTDLGIN